MDRHVQLELERRIKRLEDEQVRLRKGVVTGTGPLDVDLGNSGVSIEGVPRVDGVRASVNDNVAALVSGNQVLVLGTIAGRPASVGVAGIEFNSGGSPAAVGQVLNVAHGLGKTPTVVIATPADLPDANHHMSVAAAGRNATKFDLYGRTVIDGHTIGPGTIPVAWAAFA